MSKVYAFKLTTEDVEQSTSGGAFFEIVHIFFLQGEGIVYGAALDADLVVRHRRATTIEECNVLRKSKYVRSDTNGINESVMNDLLKGHRVLFSGTPCQVYSLKVFLHNHYVDANKLITIDLICNGAPDAKVWSDYVAWLELKTGKRLKSFGFREKGDRLNPYLSVASFVDGQIIKDDVVTACYNRLFLKKLIVPNGCFNCPFKKEDRISDITLADFWGASTVFDEDIWKDEVSLVLVNTDRGLSIFNPNLVGADCIIRECYNKEYMPFQLNLKGVSSKPKMYDAFWQDYANKGFDYILKKYADVGFPKSLLYRIRRFARSIKSLI